MGAADLLPALSASEAARYARHLVLPEFGESAQRRLKAGSVLLVGAGGLGSPAALYLAAAGVGRIGIVDPDHVEASNLQRQVAHGHATLGMAKTASAARRMHDLNPDGRIEQHPTRLTAENALALVGAYDVVVDGTDNFAARYLVNDACVKLGKPNVYGGVLRFDGQLSVFDARVGPCYRCIFPEPPPPELAPSCAEAGVLGVLPGVIGTLQATEAIKLLAGIGRPLVGELLVYDGLTLGFERMAIARAPACPCCSRPREAIVLQDLAVACASAPAVGGAMAPAQLRERLQRDAGLVLLDVRNPPEWLGGTLPGAVRLSKPAIEDALHTLRARQTGWQDTVLAQVPRDRDVLVYCQSGLRSRAVIAALAGAGWDAARLHNLEQGYAGWVGLQLS